MCNLLTFARNMVEQDGTRALFRPSLQGGGAAGAAGAAGAGAAGADGAEATLGVSVLPHVGVVRAGGVELRGLKVSLAPRRLNAQAAPKLERYACTSSTTKQTSNIQIFSCANRTVYRVLAVHFCFS